eukprot:TRINITY_DN4820_c0_g1_i1.p1 TRINITY_DN4820_c0_g1~~TRINITY_DN4820_c0_g1_i1.p1  ORF type:complete len:211 (-),score=56.84 TRINITY_DN4820_c0_g1_i1:54-686(-)
MTSEGLGTRAFIKVVGARGLAAADMNGLSDPYFVLTAGDATYKSKVVPKNLNPVWNEWVSDKKTGLRTAVNFFKGDILSIELYDKDLISDDNLGGIMASWVDLEGSAQAPDASGPFSIAELEAGRTADGKNGFTNYEIRRYSLPIAGKDATGYVDIVLAVTGTNINRPEHLSDATIAAREESWAKAHPSRKQQLIALKKAGKLPADWGHY